MCPCSREVMRLAVALCVLAVSVAAAPADFIPPGQYSPSPPVRERLQVPKGIEDVDKALAAFEQRNYNLCFQHLQTAAKQHPDLFPARVMLAKLFLRSGQLGPGRATLEQAAVEHPDLAEIYLLFGQLALEDNRLTDATLQFQKAAAVAAADKGPEVARRIALLDAHSGLATVAERRRDWSTAAAALTAWLELEPKNAKARQRLGQALFRQGKTDEAQAELERAVKDDSSLEPAAITMGLLYTEQKDLKKAGEWMERARRQGPESSKVLLGYAGWLLEQDRAAEAKPHADAAGQLDPVSPEIRVLRGMIAYQLRDYETAESIFQRLHQEAPANQLASNQLALALVEQTGDAKHRQALELAEVNARLYPNSGEALTTLGLVYYRLGRLEDAERVLRLPFANGNATSVTAYFLARTLAARGRTDQVNTLLNSALNAPGRFAFRAEAEAWLKTLPK